jgi:hypothetical protein
MFCHCFTRGLPVQTQRFELILGLGRLGNSPICEGSRGCDSLRDIKVNTLEPLLKTLTPAESLIWQGFRVDEVKLYGIPGEQFREGRVMGFGELGEEQQERK